jgi:aminoglycoside phosphotransferase (APT) family kinase protein
MHAGEFAVDADVVARLVAAQFPELAGLPIRRVDSTGTVNAIYRIGSGLCARLPRLQRMVPDLEHEWRWLAGLAPFPVAAGSATGRDGPAGRLVSLSLGHLHLDRGPALRR